MSLLPALSLLLLLLMLLMLMLMLYVTKKGGALNLRECLKQECVVAMLPTGRM